MVKKIICSFLVVAIIFLNLPPLESKLYAQPSESRAHGKFKENNSAELEKSADTQTAKSNSEILPAQRGDTPYYSHQAATANFGAQFQVDQFSGAAVATIPLTTPPGRRGIQPNLSLIYSSQNSNGICGVGWNLDLGSIARSTKKGPPVYNDSIDTFILTINGTSKELVSIGNNEFRTKIEEDFKRFKFEGNFWVVTDNAGIKYYFGHTHDSQIFDGSYGTFKWCLDRIEDLSGNYLTINYSLDQNQIYPASIYYTYNNINPNLTLSSVEFSYDDSRPDKATSYCVKFPISTNKRLTQVNIKTGSQQIRRYELQYKNDSISNRSLLASVKQFGAQNAELPAIMLDYYIGKKGWLEDTAHTYPIPPTNYTAFAHYRDMRGFVVDNGVRLGDINNDGIVDFIRRNTAGGQQPLAEDYICLSNGHGWDVNYTWEWPEEAGWFTLDYITYLVDNGARLADINGDGFVDCLRYNNGEPSKVFINNQNNTWVGPDSAWAMPAGSEIMNGSVYHGVIFVDVNNDGYVDIVKANGTNSWEHSTWLNNGINNPGWTRMSSWDIPVDGKLNITNGSTELVDVNADSLPDIVYADGGEHKTYINTGNGWQEQGVWALPEGSFTDDGCKLQLIDVNCDGLSDLLISSDGVHKIYFNNGQGFNPQPTQDPEWALDNAIDFRHGRTRIIDANADGLIDIIRNWQNEGGRLFLHKGIYEPSQPQDFDYPDLLKSISSPTGAVTTVQYAPSSQFNNKGEDGISDLGFPVQVVTQVTSTDIIRNQAYVTTYQYSGGLFDYPDREFRGFGKVTSLDPEGNFSEVYSRQDDLFKGKPSRKTIKDADGNIIQDETYSWASMDLGNGTVFPFQAQVDTYIYPTYSREIKHTKVKQEFDFQDTPYGKIISKSRKLTFSNANDKSGLYDLKETTEFVSKADAENWLIGLPIHSWVEDAKIPPVRYRQAWFYYDQAHSQDPNDITKGFLTKQTGWQSSGGSNSRDIPEPVDPCVYLTYDEYGNLASKSSPRNPLWLTTTTYDEDYQQYPYITTNALGQQAESIYDPKFGQATYTKDPNGIEACLYLDEFGRTEREVGPYDTFSEPRARYEYILTEQPIKIIKHTKATYRQSLVAPTYITTYAFLDGLGRVIQTKSPAEDPFKQILSGYQEYDSRGQVIRKYYPWLVENTGASFTPIDTAGVPYVKFEYDAIGRNLKTSYPKSDGIWTDVLTAYDGWDVATVDANHHQKIARNDAFGRLIRVEEFAGEFNAPNFLALPYAITKYEYNPIGELTKVIDDAGNVTQIAYDTLGRKLWMDDPDMGHYEYDYDAAGNLIRQTDNKNQTMEFTYDKINRLVSKAKAGLPGEIICPVSYHYDFYTVNPNEATNTVGRLVEVFDASGNTKFYYDKLGRETRSQKSIDKQNFSVEREYDALDRLTSVIYPDNFVINYAYNLQGQVESIKSDAQTYVSNVNYDHYNQITKIIYGNGVATEYSYDDYTRLLKEICAYSSTLNIQKLQYTFDDVGNITNITDCFNPQASQHFVYDFLDRLASANGLYGAKIYGYDKIGNIICKDGFLYRYGDNCSGPHAVTSITNGLVTYNYFYDTNGNMIWRDAAFGAGEQALDYDYENRLIRVRNADNKTLAQYFYDGDGGRVKKLALHQEGGLNNPWPVEPPVQPSNAYDKTVYVGSLFEVYQSAGQPVSQSTKHIFLGPNRICSLDRQTGGLEDQLTYFHADHLGSSNVLTNEAGEIIQQAEYTPFGEFVDGFPSELEFITNYFFTGKELDAESGLYYYGARYYDPFLGRFITPDSIIQAPSDPQSLNRYSYCRNNPLKYTDPTGHSWWSSFWKSLFGGLVGGVVGLLSGQPLLGMAAYNGVMAALEGGNYGAAISGMLSGYGWGVGVARLFGNFWGTIASGVMGGIASARVAGADIGQAALAGLAGSITGYGVGAITGFAGLGSIIGSGVASEVGGGDFAGGALGGVGYNIGFTIGSSFATMPTSQEVANVQESGDSLFYAGERIWPWYHPMNLAQAVFGPGPFNHCDIGLGDGLTAGSHPSEGPEIRDMKEFGPYKNERVARIKGDPKIGQAAKALVTDMKAKGVGFGYLSDKGSYSSNNGNTVFCSQFTSQVYESAGKSGVYGLDPNTQYWYLKK